MTIYHYLVIMMDEEEALPENIVKCNECGSRDLTRDTDRGEVSCNQCGLVLEEQAVDLGAEWRTFQDSDGSGDRSRVGAPMTHLIHDKGLSTDIDWRNKDYSGKSIDSKTRAQFYRMRKWQNRARNSTSHERNLVKAIPEARRICEQLKLTKGIAEEVVMLYKRVLDSGLVKGRSIDAIAASCVYIVCSRNKLGRTLDEVSKVSRIGRKELARCYKTIKNQLRLKTEITKAQDFVPAFCSKLDLSTKVQTTALAFIEQADEKEATSGKSPTGIAAAAIYIASHVEGTVRTQRELADVSSVTEVTIRNRYKELLEVLDIDSSVFS